MQNTGIFFTRNGREVFENPQRRLWHCGKCGWWREWEAVSCCGCGSRRDAATISVHASVLASFVTVPKIA